MSFRTYKSCLTIKRAVHWFSLNLVLNDESVSGNDTVPNIIYV